MYKLMKKIKRLIRSYDNFGVSPNFNIRNKKQYQSECGGLMSIIMTFVLIYFFVTGIISLILRDKFQVDVQQLQNMNPDYQEMNITNFMFAIKLDNPFSITYPNDNKTAFQIVMNQVQISDQGNGTRNKTTLYKINFEQCTENHFKHINFDSFQEIKDDLSAYLCPPLNYSIKLQGTFNSKHFLYPALKVSLCYTENCYTKEQVYQLAQNKSLLVQLSTLIQSSIYMRNNKNDFLVQHVNSDFYLQTNLMEERTADIFFKNNNIIIENSILSLFKEEEKKNFWQFSLENYRELNEYHDSPSTIFSVNFRISQAYEQTKKTVYTLDSFLSYFGGMLKIISTLFGFFALKYNEIGLKISIGNHLYQFNIPKKKDGKFEFSYDKLLSIIQKSINRVNDLQQKLKHYTKTVIKTSLVMRAWNSQKFQNQQSTSNLEKQQRISLDRTQIDQLQYQKYIEQLQDYKGNFLQRLITTLNSTRHDLKLGMNFIVYEFLWCTCCEKVEITKKMLDQTQRVIDRDLDIFHLLQKIQEIDKLKSIILEKDQLKVFNYTPKPIININPSYQYQPEEEGKCVELFQQVNSQKKKCKIRRYRFNRPKKLIKIYDSYSRLKQHHNHDKNQRIIQLLGPTIEMIFQKYYEIQNMNKQINNGNQENFENTIPQSEFQNDVVLPVNFTQRVNTPNQQMNTLNFQQITPKTLPDIDEEFLQFD
ncbi:unnamed protein product [Paramecium sonneborni]|uniref:Transmembrane protein n=1 Tax=Paramecium sonneborni TaxID=65129 RepID=A0A8S1LI82_9CILI|nr:unnamed protein product [Paramecium sonneborni]